MRDPAEVLVAIRAELGELDDATAAALRSRLTPLSSQFESIDAPTLGRALASRVKVGADLVALHLEDLLLAQACLAQDAGALAELEGRVPQVIRAMRHRASVTEQEELAQQLLIRLLVPLDKAPAKLLLYAGRGALNGYMRVVALNLLIRAQAPGPDASDGALAGLPDLANWESGVLRADQQVQFREAFRRAVMTLTARQRSLLRLNLLDGLSIDELAPLYGAHRSSVARWLAEAKDLLDSQTRKLLGELLKLDFSGIEQLLTATQAGFQLSLDRALRESMPPAKA